MTQSVLISHAGGRSYFRGIYYAVVVKCCMLADLDINKFTVLSAAQGHQGVNNCQKFTVLTLHTPHAAFPSLPLKTSSVTRPVSC